VSELRFQGSERGQTSQKELDRGHLDEGFTTGRQALVIASQTPEADQPGTGALDFSAVLLEWKTATFGLRAWNDLPIDENGFPCPFLGRLVDRFGDDLGLPAQV